MEKRAQDILSRRLWSAVDHAETRLNKFADRAQVGRKVILALPRELDREGWVSAVRGFVRETYIDGDSSWTGRSTTREAIRMPT